MDTKFVYHPIISSHCGDEEEDADFLLDDLPFSRLKEVQTNCTIKEECEMSQACSLSVPVKQAQKSEDVAQLEHSFNIISAHIEKSNISSKHHKISFPKTLATPPRSYSRCSSQTRKERTPRTMLKLMERHRENERVRHHTLNESLRVICQLIPGCSNDGRETKVVMMQRIISYIAYLENSISSLFNELGMHFNSSTTPLVNRLKRKIEAKIKAGKRKEDPPHEIKYAHYHHYGTRRLKLSSPTVDSTTDTVPIWMPHKEYVKSQGSPIPSSTFVTLSSIDNSSATWQTECDSEEDIISNTGDYDPFFDSEMHMSGSDCFGISDKYFISPNKNISSSCIAPDFSNLNTKFVSTEKHLPLKIREPGFSDYNVSSSFDMVIASTVPREDVVSTNLVTSATLLPSPLSAFRKYVPFSPSEYKCVSSWPVRSPLHNVTNWPSKDIPQTTCIADSSHLPQTCVTGVEKENDGTTGFCGTTVTWKQKAQAFKVNWPNLRDNCIAVNVSGVPDGESKESKVDLRKTSWMNGFMMYSRLNRKKFIEANPGVLTSNISKMMGQAWRNMSDAEQIPYKEKAKHFFEEIQKDEANCGLNVLRNGETATQYTLVEPITEESLDSLLTVKQEEEFVF